MQSVLNKVVRRPVLVHLTGLSRSTLADLQNPKSPRFDATFPTKIRLSCRSIGYFSCEVFDWLESRKVVSPARGKK